MDTQLQQGRYILPLAMLFTAVLLISNTVAVKITQIGPFTFDAATLLFPIAYIFGDVLTEVYGYKATRKIVRYAIYAQILMAVVYAAVQYLPAASFWDAQGSYESILGVVPRIVFASLVAFFAGELANAYILSRMKVRSMGKQLWKRTISSTVVGQAIDTVLFVGIAFAGTMAMPELYAMLLSNYIFKVVYEVCATPLTYIAVGALKKKEQIDVYDTQINYNPFTS
jgi:queuosine precursor transporter